MVRRAEQSKYSLESIDRMVAVLDAFESAGDQPLERVARTADLNESTALRYLMSLAKHGFVERSETTGSFRLGLRLFRLGMLAVDRRDVVTIARPVMTKLLDAFQESVNLATRQQNTVVLLSVMDSPNPLRKGSRAGETDSWHATSLGKSLLAEMSDADAEVLLRERPLLGFTPNTITAIDQIQRDLEAIRTRGYAIDDEESVEGLRCVGAAIRDHEGTPCYAFSISGPKSRMSYSRIQEIGTALARSAAEVSLGMGAEAAARGRRDAG